jgi:hypothetical protein
LKKILIVSGAYSFDEKARWKFILFQDSDGWRRKSRTLGLDWCVNDTSMWIFSEKYLPSKFMWLVQIILRIAYMRRNK